MKALLFSLALLLSCYASASAAMPLALGTVAGPSVVATLLGAGAMLAGLLRFRRRR